MSHDRGCFVCGVDRWEYDYCRREDCPKKEISVMGSIMDYGAEIERDRRSNPTKYKAVEMANKQARKDMKTFNETMEMLKGKKKMEEKHDFGFTAVSAEELKTNTVDKMQGMVDLIMPLLENLKKNPEKEMIKWPNRVAEIDKFINKLQTYVLMNGDK